MRVLSAESLSMLDGGREGGGERGNWPAAWGTMKEEGVRALTDWLLGER